MSATVYDSPAAASRPMRLLEFYSVKKNCTLNEHCTGPYLLHKTMATTNNMVSLLNQNQSRSTNPRHKPYFPRGSMGMMDGWTDAELIG